LLDAAQELYESGGSEAMSFRAIADLAGCSHSKLYSYFDSKADLIDGLRVRCYRLLFDTLTDAVAAEDDPLKSLESLAHAYIALGLNQTRFYGLLYTREGKLAESESPLFEAKSRAWACASRLSPPQLPPGRSNLRQIR
jgi:AcrR family transcriptional regulator